MNKLYYLFFFYFLISCTSTEQLIDYSSAPQWVQEYPLSSEYYIGIGIAKKKGVKDYRDQAKKNALNEISSVISVSVSSNSVLKQQENNGKFKEMFNTTTKTYTNNELAGCKQVGRWENKDEYWVYFKLEKAKVEEGKRIAIEDATISLRQALNYDVQNDYPKAISNYSMALSAVKPYLGSRLKTEFNGETIFLGQFILDSYRELITSVKLVYDTSDPLLYQPFKTIKPLKVKLTRNNDSLTNIPIKIDSPTFKYVGSYKFNERGEVTLPEVNANTYRNKELVVLSIDIAQLIEESVSDDLVKEILKGFKTTSLELLYKEEKISPTGNEETANNTSSSEPEKENKPIEPSKNPYLPPIIIGEIKGVEVLNDIKEATNELSDLFNENMGSIETVQQEPSVDHNSTVKELKLSSNQSELIAVVKNETFESDKLMSVKQFLSQNNKSYTTETIVKAAENFGFEASKLDFAKYAYLYVVDKGNYYKMNSIFNFNSTKEEFNNFINK